MASDYQKFKDVGNDKFKMKEFEAAKRLYTQAIEAKRDEPVAYLNRAACNLNLKLYYDVLEDCNQAIMLDPTMCKAFYRRANALFELSRLNLSRADYSRASKLDPQSKIIRDELAKLEAIIRQNTRVDVKNHEKPERFRSKKGLQSFELNNQYSGTRQYNISQT